MVKHINDQDFNTEVIEASEVVVVDFWATWCGPCKMIAPVIEELANEMENVKFVKVDVDKNPGSAGKYQIQSIPTLLIFKDGKVVDFSAEQGEEALKNLLAIDEGAKHLGEVALVPDPSPISQSGLIFYNTLFDENASNHLAFGSAYAFNLQGGTEMSEEELAEAGLNRSQTHVDFMVGSDKMNIDGIKEDGTIVPVFRNGDWA